MNKQKQLQFKLVDDGAKIAKMSKQKQLQFKLVDDGAKIAKMSKQKQLQFKLVDNEFTGEIVDIQDINEVQNENE